MSRGRVKTRVPANVAGRRVTPPVPATGNLTQFILGLQRTAGNKAVQSWLQRAPEASEVPRVTAGTFRAGLARALRDAGETVTPHHVTVHDDGALLKFALRIGHDRHVLPSIDQVLKRKPAPGTVPGARFLLQGSLQQAGDNVRVAARMVVVETSEIVRAGLGDAAGHDLEAVYAAARLAIEKLGPLEATPDSEGSSWDERHQRST